MFRNTIIFISLLLLFDIVNAASFGLETPIWQRMWKNGMQQKYFDKLNKHEKLQWDVSAENLNIYQGLGATWNIIVVRQTLGVDPDWKRLHKILDEHKKKGINVVFRLIEDPKVYGEFSDSPDTTFGYDKKYYAWVKSIADTFASDVNYYLIGNEIDTDLGYNLAEHKKLFINIHDYEKLVSTARKALKSINDKIMLVDHGVSAFTLGIAVADDIYKKDGIDAAAEFWSNFQFKRVSVSDSKSRLKYLLSSKRVNIANAAYSLCRYYDAVQLHYYFSSVTLPAVVSWMQNKLSQSNCDLPVIATEVGYRMDYIKGDVSDGRAVNVADWSKYSPEDHAATLVKDFTILLSKGVNMILYWQARFHHDRNPSATIYKSTGRPKEFILQPAGISYRFFTRTMSNAVFNSSKIINSSNVYEYTFTTPDKLSIVWSDSIAHIALLNPSLPEISSAYDMYGNPVVLDNNKKLIIDTRPIYIFWK